MTTMATGPGRHHVNAARTALYAVHPLSSSSGQTLPLASQLLFGETVDVQLVQDGYAFLRNDTDGYRGYVQADALTPGGYPATHRVSTVATHLYMVPDIKSVPHCKMSYGSRLYLDPSEPPRGKFRAVAEGAGWILDAHVSDVVTAATDYVELAEHFIGVPYLWGGRSCDGIDCSALVQLCLNGAGLFYERDTTQQRENADPALWEMLAPDTALMRGDIVFFPGHVGFMVDEERLIHANATHMSVTTDPVMEVAAWTEKSDGAGILTVHRPRRQAG